MNDFLDNLVAVLVGTQRVLITFSDHEDDKLMREQIHGAEIYHFKLKIFINRENEKSQLFAPMDELHEMMMRRKNDKWIPNEEEKKKIDGLLLLIQNMGTKLIQNHMEEINKSVGDIGPDFLWTSKRNNLGG